MENSKFIVKAFCDNCKKWCPVLKERNRAYACHSCRREFSIFHKPSSNTGWFESFSDIKRMESLINLEYHYG